ncbi:MULTISPECIES: MarR family transcriptional regulator [unclassified Halomonas]|uniref:MarR family winged helix-turn-helix transcriptional regulator n=1 Tax=unclassified Halomonas TaxID=2609666 RepID=UPI000C9672F2|nr:MULTISPECIES: MarR family transcriptional regulator [unclassified Halomonas]MAR71958.1 MarR family transcriptional regulator [Halomonas sp.]MBY5943036.1 MarR family transcriptional regulator [Halomonas sp. DP5N14-9]
MQVPSTGSNDAIDRLMAEWCRVLPDRDPGDMGIFTRLYRVLKHVDRRVQAVFRQHGLKEGEFDLLATLYRRDVHEGLTPNALCEAVVLSSGAMTHRLDRLASRGLVERVANPEDRRSVLIRLSESGKAMMPALLDAYLAELASMRATLADDEAAGLAAGLRQLLLALEGEVSRDDD